MSFDGQWRMTSCLRAVVAAPDRHLLVVGETLEGWDSAASGLAWCPAPFPPLSTICRKGVDSG
jgi:hypothetical protein